LTAEELSENRKKATNRFAKKRTYSAVELMQFSWPELIRLEGLNDTAA
jgi:hypothetical protein